MVPVADVGSYFDNCRLLLFVKASVHIASNEFRMSCYNLHIFGMLGICPWQCFVHGCIVSMSPWL